MKKIKLTKGYFAIVDDGWFEKLNRHEWFANVDSTGRVTAARWDSKIIATRKCIYMHRQIMGNPYKKLVDHKDGNALNNRVNNLRICTCAQNQYNHKLRSDNTSGYMGVTYHKIDKKWMAELNANGKRIYCERFDTKEQAARARDRIARKYHGKFARLNKVPRKTK